MALKLLEITNHRTITIDSFLKDQEQGEYASFIVKNEYQRDYIWKELRMKKELIHSIFFDRPIGTIITWNKINQQKMTKENEIVDGQQRLKTIELFSKGNFKLDYPYLKDIINNKIYKSRLEKESEKLKGNWNNLSRNDIKDADICKKMLNINDKSKFGFKDFPRFLQQQFLGFELNLTEIGGEIDEEDIRNYFGVLQNQEKLRAGELIHSSYNNPIEKIFNEKELEYFSNTTNFNNERKGLLKHITSTFGMLLKIMKVGLPDDQIIKKIISIEEKDIRNNYYCLNFIDNFKKDLEKKLELSKKETKLKVLGLKLIFMSYIYQDYKNGFFYNLSLGSKADLVKNVCEIVGYWNSRDETKKDTIISILKEKCGASDEVISGFGKIRQLSTSSHGFDSFDEKRESVFLVLEFMCNFQDFSFTI